MRIALGPLDPAGVGAALAIGLRARGHDVSVVLVAPNPFGYPADGELGSRFERLRFALGAARRYDVLHALWGRSWFSYADLALTRARGRTCVIQYNGSDVRTSDVARRVAPARARIVEPSRDRVVRLHLGAGALAAQAALVQDLELVAYVRRSFRAVYVLPFAIDLPAIEQAGAAAQARAGGPLRVVHAPSNRRVKGSDAIEAAATSAAERVPLELVFLTGRPHRDVLAELASADVVIDQLNAETPGVLAAEAMALGKPVLCEYDAAKLASFARPCPTVAVTADDLADRLVGLCRDPERRRRLGQQGVRYARAVHAPERASAAAEQVYAHVGSGARGVFEATPEGVRPLER